MTSIELDCTLPALRPEQRTERFDWLVAMSHSIGKVAFSDRGSIFQLEATRVKGKWQYHNARESFDD
jgi:hypothetical protein